MYGEGEGRQEGKQVTYKTNKGKTSRPSQNVHDCTQKAWFEAVVDVKKRLLLLSIMDIMTCPPTYETTDQKRFRMTRKKVAPSKARFSDIFVMA